MTKREKIVMEPGDALVASLIIQLLANKNVHDISDADILKAGQIVERVVRSAVYRGADAVT